MNVTDDSVNKVGPEQMKRHFLTPRETALAVLMLFQSVCMAFFLSDIFDDLSALPSWRYIDLHLGIELFANLGLLLAILAEGLFLNRLLMQHARAERALSAATGALHDIMQGYFESWGLTAAEADVATFTIKGFSIAEIAKLRQSAEGTVKSQLNAIYRKSGMSGRGQLVSLLIEDLLVGPIASKKRSAMAPEETALE